MTQYELGYLVGSIDGEGAIMIKLQGKRRTYRPTITITSTTLQYLEYLRKITGFGTITTHNKGYADRHKRKRSWVLLWQNYPSTKKICNLLINRAIVKKLHSRLLLKFIKIHQSYKGWRNFKHIPKSIMRREKVVFKQLRKINVRGKNLRKIKMIRIPR